MNKNIEYYNLHADDFFKSTVNVDMSLWRDKFEAYIPQGGTVLDAGCGSGRDSKAFMDHGFAVQAFDASEEMCRMASELLGQKVLQMKFDEVNFESEFHGIWACASLLHVPIGELPDAIAKLKRALVPEGILYASFKYGEGSMKKGDRSFCNFNEESICELFEKEGFAVLAKGISIDGRPGRSDEKWINAIAKKSR